MSARCDKIDFILYREEEVELVKVVPNFKYMGRPLDQADDDWPEVWKKIMRSRSVWGRLGMIIRREGPDPKVSSRFYRAVIKAVLLFGVETWVLFMAMEQKVEGTHTGFLRKITGKRVRRLPDVTRETPRAEAVREAAGTQFSMKYIGRRQETVAQWVAWRLIFKVCTGEKG